MMCGGMMLLLIPGAISNSNAVIRQEFRKLRFQMIDDSVSNLSENLMHAAVGSFKHFLVCLPLSFSRHQPFESCEQLAYANRFGNVPVHPGQEAKAPKAWRNSLASTSMKCAEE